MSVGSENKIKYFKGNCGCLVSVISKNDYRHIWNILIRCKHHDAHSKEGIYNGLLKYMFMENVEEIDKTEASVLKLQGNNGK